VIDRLGAALKLVQACEGVQLSLCSWTLHASRALLDSNYLYLARNTMLRQAALQLAKLQQGAQHYGALSCVAETLQSNFRSITQEFGTLADR
jgi:hypothetical protein